MSKLKKVFRYIKIYGFSRTLYKVLGRSRLNFGFMAFSLFNHRRKYSVGFVGAGQFPFATIGYFVKKSSSYDFSFVYDIDKQASISFSRLYSVRSIVDVFNIDSLPKVDLVYIASNHSTHCKYAVDLIERGYSVYVEKPIVVNWSQFYELGAAINKNTHVDVFVGYNRPFSKAIETIKSLNFGIESPFSMSCFIVGHFIPEEHWYREPGEGTRVCGNLGHWLDLFIHMLFFKRLPSSLQLQISYSNDQFADDDLTVVLTSDLGDLASITLTSRSEPFEGINETINFHQADLIATISDFREAMFWKGEDYFRRRYFPKDVGHKKAILQHLNKNNYIRNMNEIRLSSALMLEVKDMVLQRDCSRRFVLDDVKYKWN